MNHMPMKPLAGAHVRQPTRRALAKQATREKILASARDLFAEKGYEGATIRDIASAAENLFRHAPPMHFARAVINPEGAHVHEDAHHDGLCRYALPAKDLHAAVNHAPFRFGTSDLGSA